jgi:hypothetical protein
MGKRLLAAAAIPVAMLLLGPVSSTGVAASSGEFTTQPHNIDKIDKNKAIAPYSWIAIGFTVMDHNNKNASTPVQLTGGQAFINYACSANGAQAGTLTIPLTSLLGTLPANYNGPGGWFPTNQQSAQTTYQTSIVVPPTLCGGNAIYLTDNPATFTGTLLAPGAPNDQFHIQFHVAIPNALGLGNVNCANPSQNPTQSNGQGVSACNFGWTGDVDNLLGNGTPNGGGGGGGGNNNACQTTSVDSFLPDPVLGSAANKYLSDTSSTITPSGAGVIGIPTNSPATGSVSNPVQGNKFADQFADETEIYEYLNNNTSGPSPNGSPGAYDATQPVLNSLPTGGPVTHEDGTTTAGGPGVLYAAVLSSDLHTILGVAPTTVGSQNYTPNPTAWQHGTYPKDPNGQPTSNCGGDGLFGTVMFDATQAVDSNGNPVNLQPGTVYAAYLLERDTDVSGPLSNHIWYFTPTGPTPQTTQVTVQNLDSCKIAVGGGTFQLFNSSNTLLSTQTTGLGTYNFTGKPCPHVGGSCVVTSSGCATFSLAVPSSGTATYTIKQSAPPSGYLPCEGGSACRSEIITLTIDSTGAVVTATTTNVYPDGTVTTFPNSANPDLNTSSSTTFQGSPADPIMFFSDKYGNTSCDGDNDADDHNNGSPSSHCDSDND